VCLRVREKCVCACVCVLCVFVCHGALTQSLVVMYVFFVLRDFFHCLVLYVLSLSIFLSESSGPTGAYACACVRLRVRMSGCKNKSVFFSLRVILGALIFLNRGRIAFAI